MDNFYVSVYSEHSREYFPNNTSINFYNKLAQPLVFQPNTYEVCLTKVSTVENKSDGKKREFFENNEEKAIKIKQEEKSGFFVPKEDEHLTSFITTFNTDSQGTYDIAIEMDFQSKRVIITNETEYILILPLDITLALGFTSNKFEKGETHSNHDFDENVYKKIPEGTQFEILLVKIVNSSVSIETPKEYKFTSLIESINKALLPYKVNVEWKPGEITVVNAAKNTTILFSDRISNWIQIPNQTWLRAQSYQARQDEQLPQTGIFAIVIFDGVKKQLFGNKLLSYVGYWEVKEKNRKSYGWNASTYVPIERSYFDTIHIQLVDEFGEEPPIASDPSLFTLHFRPREL